ncbi:MAG: hypothetical protein JKP95_00465 [Oceanicaulis sp.]|nr:hypothetical protein [Oceanicaulis sp.]
MDVARGRVSYDDLEGALESGRISVAQWANLNLSLMSENTNAAADFSLLQSGLPSTRTIPIIGALLAAFSIKRLKSWAAWLDWRRIQTHSVKWRWAWRRNTTSSLKRLKAECARRSIPAILIRSQGRWTCFPA